MKEGFREDLRSRRADAVDASLRDFDWKTLYERLEEDAESGENDKRLTFTAHEEPNAFTVEAILRNFAPVPPFVVRWDYPLMRRVDHLDPERLKQPTKSRSTIKRDGLLSLLEASPLSTTQWQKKAREELGIGSTRFYELIADLKTECAVLESEPGKWCKNAQHHANP